MTDTIPEPTPPEPAPRGVLSALDELLRRPAALVERAESSGGVPFVQLLAGAAICFAAYGAAAGFFQGGAQVLVAAFKAPLIVFASLVLCLPSLYVLSALSGVEISPRWYVAVLGGLAGMQGLLLVALMPIAWLFSVSSRSLGSLVVLHVAAWGVALLFTYRFLRRAARRQGGGALAVWVLLFALVSLQVTSQLHPVLWREPDAALFEPRRMFFLEHYGLVLDGDPVPGEP